MANNDFIDRLSDAVETAVPDQAITIGYLGPLNKLTLYPLPGGQVIKSFMDGERELQVPFEFGIKTDDQELAYQLMGQINGFLSDLDLEIPSKNGTYEFEDVTPQKPYLAGLDEKGLFIIQMDVNAKLLTKGSK